MAEVLDYGRPYTYAQAAQVLGVSLAWVEKWVGSAIQTGMVINLGTKATPKVTGADLKKIAMKRWSQLEEEVRWRAFERVRAREQGLPFEGEEV